MNEAYERGTTEWFTAPWSAGETAGAPTFCVYGYPGETLVSSMLAIQSSVTNWIGAFITPTSADGVYLAEWRGTWPNSEARISRFVFHVVGVNV